MDRLPPMDLMEVTTVPAVAEKVYANAFLQQLVIQAVDVNTHTAYYVLSAYNYKLNEVAPDTRLKEYTVSSLQTEAERIPLLKVAMGCVTTVLSLMSLEHDILAKIARLEAAGEPTGELHITLQTTREEMGIQ